MAWFRCTGGSGGSLKLRTASGRIATFETNLADELQSLKCEINAKQDLHGYDHPWAGGAGKNKLNYDAWKNIGVNGGTAVYENNGITITALTNDAYTYWTNDVFPQGARVSINEGETITLSWEETTNKNGLVYIFPNGETTGLVAANNETDKKLSYTATSGITYITFRFGAYNQGDTIAYKNIQIEKGSQATPYEPYSNICPIIGHSELNLTRCGVNIWDEEWEYVNSRVTSKNYIKVKPNTEYFFCNTKLYDVEMFDISKNSLGNPTYTPLTGGFLFTTASNCAFIKFSVANSYGTTYNNDISINYPSTDTEYHAYNGTPFTVAFGQTVYGGVYDKSGRLTITWTAVDLGSLNYSKDTMGDTWRFSATMPNDYRIPDNTQIFDLLCSIFTTGYSPINSAYAEDYQVCGYPLDNHLYLKDTDYTDANAFKTAMSGVMLAYPLSQPIVIDVPSISVFAENGTNNIVSDGGGDVDVSYLELIRGT